MPKATLYTRVTPELKARAVAAAEKEGIPLNWWITRLIEANSEPVTPEPVPGQTTLTADWATGTQPAYVDWVGKATQR